MNILKFILIPSPTNLQVLLLPSQQDSQARFVLQHLPPLFQGHCSVINFLRHLRPFIGLHQFLTLRTCPLSPFDPRPFPWNPATHAGGRHYNQRSRIPVRLRPRISLFTITSLALILAHATFRSCTWRFVLFPYCYAECVRTQTAAASCRVCSTEDSPSALIVCIILPCQNGGRITIPDASVSHWRTSVLDG